MEEAHQDDWSCLFLGLRASISEFHGLFEGYLDFLHGISGPPKVQKQKFPDLPHDLSKHRQDQPRVSMGVAAQVSGPFRGPFTGAVFGDKLPQYLMSLCDNRYVTGEGA